MHVLQSSIGLKECLVRPSFLNFPIVDDTDSALITTQMIVKAAKYMHIFCMELLLLFNVKTYGLGALSVVFTTHIIVCLLRRSLFTSQGGWESEKRTRA